MPWDNPPKNYISPAVQQYAGFTAQVIRSASMRSMNTHFAYWAKQTMCDWHHTRKASKFKFRSKFTCQKNAYALKTPHVVALPFIYGVECIQFHTLLATLKNVFWPSDLDPWPMTLIFELDLDILPLDLHTEIQVCMSVRLAVRVVTHRQTHTQTHTHTQTMSKLLHPTRHIRDVGCKNLCISVWAYFAVNFMHTHVLQVV